MTRVQYTGLPHPSALRDRCLHEANPGVSVWVRGRWGAYRDAPGEVRLADEGQHLCVEAHDLVGLVVVVFVEGAAGRPCPIMG